MTPLFPRSAAALLAAALLAGCSASKAAAPAAPAAPRSAAGSPTPSTEAFAQLEQQFGARAGLYALDTGSGREVAYHADDRFAFASTIKSLSVSTLLRHASDAELDKVVTYHQEDVLSWAPVTSKHVADGMKLRDLATAAIEQSDNTAANLVTAELGGPAAVQQALRDLGDRTTNVNRTEPTLNEATPGDTRDTSTPRAMATDLRQYVLGDTLAGDHRQLLTDWLVGNTTGGPYIRAGVPTGWKVGDKTGNGGYGTRNDIGILWPNDGHAPIVIAVLTDRGKPDAKSDDALIAQATKAALDALH
ncbi:class A beta-lactamase [Kitasatospora acidiphila]|uniref:class A beta-lactamase n=1 Tax=Kitasatospora acidiphila TaxID=2567942 RepID=UPI003C72A67F